MKTNEETMYNEQQEVDGTMINNSSSVSENEPSKSSETEWKQVIMGGATGILFGTVGMALMGSAPNSSTEEEPGKKEDENKEDDKTDNTENQTTEVPTTHVTVDDLPVASSVSDDMSFGEAFAAARAEVGAGGVFAWHGGVYGTYYATEWNNMTPEEQAEFGNRVHYGTSHASTSHHQTQSTVTQQTSNTQAVDTTQNTENHTENQQQQNTHVAQHEEHPSSEGEVRILGVEQVVDEDDGSTMTVARAEIDGSAAVFIDIDDDNIVDVAGIDSNHDGQISMGEVVDVQDQHLQMSHLQQMMDSQNYMASVESNGPDYINNANVESYDA